MAIWVRWQQYRWQARRWLRHNDPDRVATDCMWYLNRLARMRRYGPRQRPIYALKNMLVEHLYEDGYCVKVTQQRQDMICWDCDGTGESFYTGEHCWKCEGTGIYRSHFLYRFVFVIAGRRYIWHQPKGLVTWGPIYLADPEIGTYRNNHHRGTVSYEKQINELYYVTLREYLRQRGYTPEPSYRDAKPNLRDCIRRDWRKFLFARSWYRKWRNLRSRIVYLWCSVGFYIHHGTWPATEEEIPF